MPRKYELLIFDWDGTLMDSAGHIVESIQKACADLGIAVPSDRECRQIIGLGLVQALQTLLPNLPEPDYPRLTERYRHHYLGRDAEIPLFDGVPAGIRELRQTGYVLAVATGKSQIGLQRALDYHALGGYFSATRCADQTYSKPHPAMVLEILDELLVAPEQAIVIGDTSHDMLMAQNAGVDRLAVAYGAHEHDDLLAHDPVAVLHSFGEVRQWLMMRG
ncbi:MAG TPA: HAD-IIIA family hydrolase [Thiobacillaceae bacterium]|nr:HAD-IIIA family hydrolase [Thiobacillaceae bacterium]